MAPIGADADSRIHPATTAGDAKSAANELAGGLQTRATLSPHDAHAVDYLVTGVQDGFVLDVEAVEDFHVQRVAVADLDAWASDPKEITSFGLQKRQSYAALMF